MSAHPDNYYYVKVFYNSQTSKRVMRSKIPAKTIPLIKEEKHPHELLKVKKRYLARIAKWEKKVADIEADIRSIGLDTLSDLKMFEIDSKTTWELWLKENYSSSDSSDVARVIRMGHDLGW